MASLVGALVFGISVLTGCADPESVTESQEAALQAPLESCKISDASEREISQLLWKGKDKLVGTIGKARTTYTPTHATNLSKFEDIEPTPEPLDESFREPFKAQLNAALAQNVVPPSASKCVGFHLAARIVVDVELNRKNAWHSTMDAEQYSLYLQFAEEVTRVFSQNGIALDAMDELNAHSDTGKIVDVMLDNGAALGAPQYRVQIGTKDGGEAIYRNSPILTRAQLRHGLDPFATLKVDYWDKDVKHGKTQLILPAIYDVVSYDSAWRRYSDQHPGDFTGEPYNFSAGTRYRLHVALADDLLVRATVLPSSLQGKSFCEELHKQKCDNAIRATYNDDVYYHKAEAKMIALGMVP